MPSPSPKTSSSPGRTTRTAPTGSRDARRACAPRSAPVITIRPGRRNRRCGPCRVISSPAASSAIAQQPIAAQSGQPCRPPRPARRPAGHARADPGPARSSCRPGRMHLDGVVEMRPGPDGRGPMRWFRARRTARSRQEPNDDRRFATARAGRAPGSNMVSGVLPDQRPAARCGAASRCRFARRRFPPNPPARRSAGSAAVGRPTRAAGRSGRRNPVRTRSRLPGTLLPACRAITSPGCQPGVPGDARAGRDPPSPP